MYSQTIVQWNYIIYFYIRGSFLNNFCTNFWKRVYNSKDIVNIQGLFVLIVGYLFISTFSLLLFLYTVSWRYKRHYLHANIYILFYIMFYIINTKKKHFRTNVLTIQKKSRFEPGSAIPLFVATPLGMGAFHVLIVCHLPALITSKFFMIFNPANYD